MLDKGLEDKKMGWTSLMSCMLHFCSQSNLTDPWGMFATADLQSCAACHKHQLPGRALAPQDTGDKSVKGLLLPSCLYKRQNQSGNLSRFLHWVSNCTQCWIHILLDMRIVGWVFCLKAAFFLNGKLSQKWSYYEEKEHLWQFWRLSNKSQVGPFFFRIFFFRHKIKLNLRYFRTIFCLGKNKQTNQPFFPSLLPVCGLHSRLLICLNSHPLPALRPERPHLYWHSTSLLQTKLAAGRDTFPQKRKGGVRALKCQKQADLTGTEQSTVESFYLYHHYSHVRFQSRSKLQHNVGIKSVTFHTFL